MKEVTVGGSVQIIMVMMMESDTDNILIPIMTREKLKLDFVFFLVGVIASVVSSALSPCLLLVLINNERKEPTEILCLFCSAEPIFFAYNSNATS